MQADYRDLTPDWAAELLATLTDPKFDERRIKVYTGRMLAGHWRMSTIVLSQNGKHLLDGRHRCRAVVASGVTVRVLVTESPHQYNQF
jgi:hypothetical protein